MGTIIPALGNAVFGYRPIIIGFLHVVFLGFVSFYIFFNFLEAGVFARARISTAAIWSFIAAVTLNETILLIEGVGLMFYSTNRLYPWLLWVASICLVAAVLWTLLARLKRQDRLFSKSR